MLEALLAIAEETYPYPRNPTVLDSNFREWADVAHYLYVELAFKAKPATLLAQFEMNGYKNFELRCLHRLLDAITSEMPLQETLSEKETRENKLAAFNAESERARGVLEAIKDIDGPLTYKDIWPGSPANGRKDHQEATKETNVNHLGEN